MCRFLTLTLAPSKLREGEDVVKHLRKVFDKFRVYLRRKYGIPPRYITVLEFTVAGQPHLHILIDRYIPQKWISLTWASLGGGSVVHIKRVTVRNISRYLAKYLTKELLLSAPKGTRRITTARAIRLFPKYESEIDWHLQRSSIWFLLSVYRDTQIEAQADLFPVLEIKFDDENYLKAFSVPARVVSGGVT